MISNLINKFYRQINFYLPSDDKASEIRFILISHDRQHAIQYNIYTGWQSEKYYNKIATLDLESIKRFLSPLSIGLFYHNNIRLNDGDSEFDSVILNTKTTYFGEYGDDHEKLLNIFITNGEESLWNELEKYYYKIFGDN